MHKLAMMLLAVAAGVAITSGSAQAAEGDTETPKKHIVAAGESLSVIAAAHTLETWRPIWNANQQLANPDVLNIGQELIIPATPTTDRPLPSGYGEPVAVVQSAPVQSYQQSVPAPAPVKRQAVAPAASGDVFARIRSKESGGNYAINTGNGYYGAYQFSLGTWRSVGGQGLPSQASPAEQDMRAKMLYDRRGCSPWPNTCN